MSQKIKIKYEEKNKKSIFNLRPQLVPKRKKNQKKFSVQAIKEQ
jgi:hypothetical protein